MNLFKKLFGKEKLLEKPIDLGLLHTDMHSHLIPAIDDGSKSMDESIQLVRSMAEMGYKKLIITPHIMADRYKNNPEIILSGLEKLKAKIQNNNINIELEAAAEYLLDDGLETKVEQNNLLTFGDNNILIELSYFSEPPNLKSILFDLQIKGYNVILAHPERYVYWHDKFEKYEDLYHQGIFLQLNINSLTGWYSEESKRIAQKLIDQKLIKYLGSDTHNDTYINELSKSRYMPYLAKALDTNPIRNHKL